MWIMVNKIRQDITEDRDRRNREVEFEMFNFTDEDV